MGARRFEDFTRSWVRHRAAIVIDDEVKSAPMIMSTIAGGRIQITMGAGADPKAAERLADALTR